MGIYRYGGKVFAGSSTKTGAKKIADRYRKKYGDETSYRIVTTPRSGEVKQNFPKSKYVVVAKRK